MSNRIMVCDDAAFMRGSVKAMLQKNGYEVIAEAENGAEAVKLYKKSAPDLVLLDITMPKMDGCKALAKIMKTDRTAKVIMMAAMGQDELGMDCILNGARDFIVKPFQEKALIDLIKRELK